MDWIIAEQIELWPVIGVSAREREQATGLLADLRLAVDLAKAGRSDNLADTLDYAAIVEFVRTFSAQQRCILLEALSELLCAELFATYPQIQRIELAIYKVGLLPNVGRVGVMVQRQRGSS